MVSKGTFSTAGRRTSTCLNITFLILGLLSAGVGVWILVSPDSIQTVLNALDLQILAEVLHNSNPMIKHSKWLLVAFGGLFLLTSLVGFCRAVKKTVWLVRLHYTFLALILLLQVLVVVLLFVYKTGAEEKARTVLVRQLSELYQVNETDVNAFSRLLNVFMLEAKCCGINNGSDFETAEAFQRTKRIGQKIPLACCQFQNPLIAREPKDRDCENNPTPTNSHFGRGCIEALKWSLSKKLIGGIVMGFITILVQILGMAIVTRQKARDY